MKKRVLVCLTYVGLAGVCTALDQAQFDADVCYMTNKILNGHVRHARRIVYPGLDGFQKWRGLSDEDFTRELLFIASAWRLNGSENERERYWKSLAWEQTMSYLRRRNVPLQQSFDFYTSILLHGQTNEISSAFSNYLKLHGYTAECFKKLDTILTDKENRKDPTRNVLLYSMKCNFYHTIFWSRPPISNVESNRIVEYMEKRVRKDSVDACYFLDTLCKAKPEFKESEEWFERVRAILADESLNEYQHKPYRDQLQEAEKRREALRASGQAEKRES